MLDSVPMTQVVCPRCAHREILAEEDPDAGLSMMVAHLRNVHTDEDALDLVALVEEKPVRCEWRWDCRYFAVGLRSDVERGDVPVCNRCADGQAEAARPSYTAADVAEADQLHAASVAELHAWLPVIRGAYEKHGAVATVAAIDDFLVKGETTPRQLRVAYGVALIELIRAGKGQPS